MKLKSIFILVILLFSFFYISGQNYPDIINLKEEKVDHMGFYKKSKEYNNLLKEKINIINLPEYQSFFAIWLPDNFNNQPIKRTLIAIHGSYGAVYPEIKDELEFAKKYKYAVVAIQWWLGKEEKYLEPEKVYEIIEIAVNYMNQKYDCSLNKNAYIGFSRGSAISYEVTFWDKFKGNNYLALTISHSGHIPPNRLTPFFQKLVNGDYGNNAFSDKNFFVYCGLKDEEWQDKQCYFMKFSKEIVEKYGGKIVGDIADPNGKHLGLRLNKKHHEKAIKKFIELTSK